MERRKQELLREIERMLHWSNEDPMLARRYKPVIDHNTRLVRQYSTGTIGGTRIA